MARPHAAGVMLATSDQRHLFVRRAADAKDYPGHWCWPGGGIDAGEGPRAAARRETYEEIGYRVGRLGEPIDRADGFATFRFLVGGEVSVVLNEEHTAACWRRLDEAPEPLHPGVRATLDRLARRERPATQFAGVRFSALGRRIVAMDARPTLRPIHPAAAARIAYEKRLNALVQEMADSVLWWLRAAYRADTPATVELAQDASPVSILQTAFDKLQRRWLRRFDELGPKLADWFVAGSTARVDGSMQTDLRKAGFTVKFKPTKAMRDAYDAVVEENIGLIRSVGQQHLEGVRVSLMQSVQNGRDLAHLTSELEKRTGITKRRAARIALDQNNKATAVMVRTRALELGITRAKWLHSAGGKHPRKEHVAFSGKTYDIAKGHDFNNGEGIVWPGTAINCRCVSVPVVPGFD